MIQTDWFPESEYGNLYQLLGPGYTIDKGKKRVTGPLVAGGKDTGVKVEIRTGGPAIGFQQVSAQMYADKTITLGQVSTDEAIQNSAKQPTLAVIAPLEISPIMIMWSKDKHPDFNTIADIGQTDTKIVYYQTDTYMQYLQGAGLVRPSQLDGSYDGSPTRWVPADGAIAQGGFATSEPYIYSNELPKKKYPNTDLQLINDTGYPMYGQALTIRADGEGQAGALPGEAGADHAAGDRRLHHQPGRDQRAGHQGGRDVQGLLAVLARDGGLRREDPARTSAWSSNGPNKTLGNMQSERVKRMVDILTPIFAAQRKPVKEGLQGGGAVHQRVHRPEHRAEVAVPAEPGGSAPAALPGPPVRLVRARHVLTSGPAGHVRDGAVAVRGDRIAAVGRLARAAPRAPGRRGGRRRDRDPHPRLRQLPRPLLRGPGHRHRRDPHAVGVVRPRGRADRAVPDPGDGATSAPCSRAPRWRCPG